MLKFWPFLESLDQGGYLSSGALGAVDSDPEHWLHQELMPLTPGGALLFRGCRSVDKHVSAEYIIW
jgi:hypothetical protein